MSERIRAGVLLFDADRVAAIERVRDGRTYHTLPGGGCEPGESPEAAAVRETWEELGLTVRLAGLAAVVHFRGNPQHYYVARRTGGAFGTGTGTELASPAESAAGSYRPVWLPLSRLVAADLLPRPLARTLQAEADRVDELIETLLARPIVIEE